MDAPPRPSIRDRVRARPGGRLGWRIGVTIVGVAVIVGGVVLLPLPGPGWLIIFAGLGILATEYEWARRLLTWGRDKFRAWTQWAVGQSPFVRGLIGLTGLIFLAGVALAGWYVLR